MIAFRTKRTGIPPEGPIVRVFLSRQEVGSSARSPVTCREMAHMFTHEHACVYVCKLNN